MDLFNLPHTAIVNRVIPKNAFDEFASNKQKKLFTDLISKIIWMYKLSPDTVNLEAFEIKEIQIFEIELKIREDIATILELIDKSISYHIVFIVVFDDQVYISASLKHPHPGNEDRAVIDWAFKSDWLSGTDNKYTLQLRRSIDAIFHNLCIQLSGAINYSNRPILELVEFKKNVTILEKAIANIKSRMGNTKQFNEKVQLNLTLKELEAKLSEIQRT
jgi:hypothetical protein